MFGFGGSPKWYRDWRQDAFHELEAKNDRLERELRLGHRDRWDYDMARRELTFSDNGQVSLRADIQIVGSTGRKDWLWSWANSHWTDNLTDDARTTRAYGEHHGIQELFTASLKSRDLNGLGWHLTAVAARLAGSIGAYRPQTEAGGLFLLIRSIDEVKSA